MTDLISRDKVHEIIAVALSDYITDEERETLETLDVDVANIPTIQAVPIDVLDKIRAEIEKAMEDFYYDEHDLGVRAGFRFALEIIGNYEKGGE